ncbi:MAG TPA: polysialyltransferase family glycosyltransferase [Niabella sp.]|nr:polysialyltransferase family glycosyltransferase [Niabella sp.]HOZ96320.1 polysialyltransferase family glycosyltransferase [Niabella sp.]HQW14604.1 polysialyltransferase family glycosyltransferase [Niabella sp.]HQX19745.1 polysialyltransferase family glycosyltransferase [Niabella sp.]HRB35778.1 polysialyltransferase family glycosyltransferase [Niabella sp.]
MSTSEFDVIIFVETGLQSKIAAWLLDNIFKENTTLVIAPNQTLRPQTLREFQYYKTYMDLHGYKKLPLSLIRRVTKPIPKFKCRIFIASFLTGLNSLFWERHINYSELGLIDDGMGTLYSLEFERIFESPRVQNIFSLINVIQNLAGKEKLNNSSDLKVLIKNYYSIYHKTYEPYNTYFVPLFEHVNNPTITKEYAFVGQPFVELNQIDLNEYLDLLKAISQRIGNQLTYFPHPKEDQNKLSGLSYIKIIDKGKGVEEYYANKRPTMLFSVYSSVIVNLSLKFGSDFIYYTPLEMKRYPDSEKYYLLMDYLGINKFGDALYFNK